MPFLLGILGLGMALLFWALRTHSTVKAVQELNSDTKGMQRRVGQGLATIFGTRLKRVNDPRLAAVILMIQLVRTGSPVTAQEKTQILELMEHPLQIANVSAMFEKAWTYTEPRSFFSQTSDELLALLR